MAQITDQVRWRRVLNHVAADLLGTIYKPSPAIADLGAIESVIVESERNLNCAIGVNSLLFPVVPPGKIWIVTNVIAFAIGGVFYLIQIMADIDGSGYWIRRYFEAASNEEVIFNGEVYLNAGDRIRVVFSSMQAGEDIYATFVANQISKY